MGGGLMSGKGEAGEVVLAEALAAAPPGAVAPVSPQAATMAATVIARQNSAAHSEARRSPPTPRGARPSAGARDRSAVGPNTTTMIGAARARHKPEVGAVPPGAAAALVYYTLAFASFAPIG